MSDQDITLALEKREIIRKGLNKLKKDGFIPAVIQNEGKESIVVSANLVEMLRVYKIVGKRHPVNCKVGSKDYLTIIKDVDFDPKKHLMRHVVFTIIKQDEKVETEVPIVMVGEAPALKLGLIVEEHLGRVEVEAFPKDLPDEVKVNVDGLEKIGDKVTVADIIPQPGVTILTEPEHTIAIIEEHVVQEEEPEEEAAPLETEETAAEPEAESAESKESKE